MMETWQIVALAFGAGVVLFYNLMRLGWDQSAGAESCYQCRSDAGLCRMHRRVATRFCWTVYPAACGFLGFLGWTVGRYDSVAAGLVVLVVGLLWAVSIVGAFAFGMMADCLPSKSEKEARIKAMQGELSDEDLCELVSARFGVSLERVIR